MIRKKRFVAKLVAPMPSKILLTYAHIPKTLALQHMDKMKHIAQTGVVRQIQMRHFKARAILSRAKVNHKKLSPICFVYHKNTIKSWISIKIDKLFYI